MNTNYDFTNYPSNDEVANNVKTKLKTLREKNNLSQGDISKMTEKSRSTVQSWERAQGDKGPIIKPDYRDLVILRDFYNISLDELFGCTSYLPHAAAGYKINKNNIHMVNERPIQFYYDDKLIWGIVGYDEKKIVTVTAGDISFDDLPDNFSATLIPNDVFREDEIFDKPLTLQELKGYISSDDPLTVWVQILIENANGLDGYYKVTSDGVQNDLGISWSNNTYNDSWVAYADEPTLLKKS